ncbi:hypothetical protein DPMN_055226 [Dreissena polymorpha]|uniref:Uncharacterized protein n=1 Tax=Dreissena polymorpha TaxID=45954 RepID=A0A9D4CPK8_DREPO|nr:hypothetical protein DPMN_055226 [Dreissena polymorpha]
MGDVIGSKTASLNITTYSAIETVKYALKSRDTTAIKMFRLRNPLTDSVDKHMAIKLRSAAARLQKTRLKAKQAKDGF